jgi:hypothetical protein
MGPYDRRTMSLQGTRYELLPDRIVLEQVPGTRATRS